MRIFGIILESFIIKWQFFDLAIYCFNDRLLNWRISLWHEVKCEFYFRKLHRKKKLVEKTVKLQLK